MKPVIKHIAPRIQDLLNDGIAARLRNLRPSKGLDDQLKADKYVLMRETVLEDLNTTFDNGFEARAYVQ